ncbi:hypothetical protein NIIDMKKI_57940 [Mycobacterium kansasii]|uniref:AMP-dependent synthetase/ligase domain-containing protein n=1 Tax=Mycobacterium kansasii TaxID=1768 RepID=A0A7G1IPE7_MYCKA|nr:hypothetical protein NIIDMKKI_57940 [Mycobacterium kansasii]
MHRKPSPQRIALRFDDLQFTFGEFDAAAARVATLLERAGVEPGDRVGVMLPNTPAFAIAFYGIMYRGAVAVPMNPLLKAREVSYYLSNSGAKALFAAPAFADEAIAGAAELGAQCWLVDDARLAMLIEDLPAQERPVSRGDDDVAIILHTSGTTGKPKGAMLTHASLGRNAEVSVRTLIQTGPDDVVMGCLPLFHVFGLTCGLNASVIAGATLTLIPRFDPRKALEVIERDAVTVFQGCRRCTPRCCAWPRRPNPRRRAACGSASPVARRCRSRFSPNSKQPSAAPFSRVTDCPRAPRWRPSIIRSDRAGGFDRHTDRRRTAAGR